MKKVLLLATGGTIACTHSEEGLTPGMSGDGILELLPELREGFAIESRDILNLDSSNIQPEEWQFMAEQVAEALPDYDGIIITHGTDTMAYTASALSYMLQNLTKPGGADRSADSHRPDVYRCQAEPADGLRGGGRRSERGNGGL